MRTQRTRIASIAAGLLLLAACSESVKDDGPKAGKDAGQDDTAAGPGTTRGVTDDSIKVGGVVYDLYFGDSRVGVEARIKEANDAGGVNGRQIEFVGAENDNNEPTKDLDLVKRLVEQEEVFALLPVMSGTFGAGDYVVDNNIPMFGYGTNPAFCENEVAFGITGCVTNPSLKVGSNALGTILEDHFDGDTDKTVAFIGEDNDAGRGGIELLSASAEDKGYDVVFGDASLPSPPEVVGDESPFVTKLLAADDGKAPDVVYLTATFSGTKIAAGLQNAGYEGMIITPSYSPLLLGQPGYDKVYVNAQFGLDPKVPAIADMLAAVKAVKADQPTTLALVAGYWSADMFIKGLEATGKDVTVEKFLETMNDDFTYEVDGAVGKSVYPLNHDQSVPCATLLYVNGKTFETELPLTCGENIKVG
ncbi:ABC transporter substrate-binding protein [soil metagenome]